MSFRHAVVPTRAGRRFRAAVIAVLSAALLIPQVAVPTVAAAAAVEGEPISAKVVFQPLAAAANLTPAGYTRDIGTAYTDAAGSGWIPQDSLTSAPTCRSTVTNNTRVRHLHRHGFTLQNHQPRSTCRHRSRRTPRR